jgi:formylglycine-generating enzyme required for sulfatase activity
VGIFPKGECPHELLDTSGNLWEWTTTKWVGSYENYRSDDQLEGMAARTLRGGSWINFDFIVRCASRDYSYPNYWSNDVGFRVMSPGSWNL